jgi:alpha-L-fucosidase
MTLNDTWGYKSDDTNWKSTQTLVRMMCDINSKGGNFMLNIGPDGKGDFPPGCVDRLKEIGAWMRVNGDAIYGSQAGPYTHPFAWGRIGRKGNTINLFVFNWPTDGQLHVPLTGKVGKAAVLGFPQMTVSASTSDKGLDLVLPKARPDEPVAVIALTFKGEPQALPSVIQPGPDGSLTLSVGDADIEGKGNLTMSMDEPPVMLNWRKENVAPVWTISVPKAGKYDVSMRYACDASKAGSDFQLCMGTNTLAGKTFATKGHDDFLTFDLGTLQIDGNTPQTVKLQPTRVSSDDFLHLREIDLRPVP